MGTHCQALTGALVIDTPAKPRPQPIVVLARDGNRVARLMVEYVPSNVSSANHKIRPRADIAGACIFTSRSTSPVSTPSRRTLSIRSVPGAGAGTDWKASVKQGLFG